MSSNTKQETNTQKSTETKPELKKNETKSELKMDETNIAAAKIYNAKGFDAAVEHMCTRPDGSPRTYSEMRSMYG